MSQSSTDEETVIGLPAIITFLFKPKKCSKVRSTWLRTLPFRNEYLEMAVMDIVKLFCGNLVEPHTLEVRLLDWAMWLANNKMYAMHRSEFDEYFFFKGNKDKSHIPNVYWDALFDYDSIRYVSNTKKMKSLEPSHLCSHYLILVHVPKAKLEDVKILNDDDIEFVEQIPKYKKKTPKTHIGFTDAGRGLQNAAGEDKHVDLATIIEDYIPKQQVDGEDTRPLKKTSSKM